MPSRALGKHGLIIPFLAARCKATIHAQPWLFRRTLPNDTAANHCIAGYYTRLDWSVSNTKPVNLVDLEVGDCLPFPGRLKVGAQQPESWTAISITLHELLCRRI